MFRQHVTCIELAVLFRIRIADTKKKNVKTAKNNPCSIISKHFKSDILGAMSRSQQI